MNVIDWKGLENVNAIFIFQVFEDIFAEPAFDGDFAAKLVVDFVGELGRNINEFEAGFEDFKDFPLFIGCIDAIRLSREDVFHLGLCFHKASNPRHFFIIS